VSISKNIGPCRHGVVEDVCLVCTLELYGVDSVVDYLRWRYGESKSKLRKVEPPSCFRRFNPIFEERVFYLTTDFQLASPEDRARD
jgi:hypothetical protein